MDKKIYKIVIINQIFGVSYNRIRWEMLANSHKDLDVTLITPHKRIVGGTGDRSDGIINTVVCDPIDNQNYHLIPVECKFDKSGNWTSKEMLKVIFDIKPDLVYHIGSHFQPSLHQCLRYVKRYLPKTKTVTFSMRGPNNNMFYEGETSIIKRIGRVLLFYPKISRVNKYSDAVLCHYPDALRAFRDEGYKKPIYISTQNGVNTDLFRPNTEYRKIIRKKYNIDDSFVFGSVTRFTPEKGIIDIIEALPCEGNWKYLLIGGGSIKEKEHIVNRIRDKGFENRFIITGYLDWENLSMHLNAMDCAIHVPKTGKWTETFSVGLVQEMASGLPVIGSDSGSVPYQIGQDGIIVPEGNIEEIRKKMEWILDHKEEAKKIGEKMKKRAEDCFSLYHLSDCIYDIFLDIIHDVYDVNKIDMTKYKVNQ